MRAVKLIGPQWRLSIEMGDVVPNEKDFIGSDWSRVFQLSLLAIIAELNFTMDLNWWSGLARMQNRNSDGLRPSQNQSHGPSHHQERHPKSDGCFASREVA